MKPLALPSILAACLSLPGIADAAVRVQVGHFAPFAASREASAVTVRVNGAVALQDFRYCDLTPYVTLGNAGRYTLEVLPSGTSTVAIAATLDLADGDYTVLAIGNGTLRPLELLPLADDNTATPAGSLRVRVVHAAPFSASEQDSEVSVRTDEGGIVGGLERVGYRAVSPYLTLPAATYDLKVAKPDNSRNLIDLAPLALPAGAVLTVVATGDGVNQPLGFSAVPLGALPGEDPVDSSRSGHWKDPAAETQGFAFTPLPGQNRLFGTWYTFGDNGEDLWLTLDSCGSTPGSIVCDRPGSYDNRRAVLTVYGVSNGAFRGANPGQVNVVGTATVEFSSCRRARLSYELGSGRSGSFDLDNLTPGEGCPPAR